MLRFRLESCRYFWNLGGYPCINQICIERRLLLFKKILDGCAPDYLSEKLLSLKYHDTRSRLPYRLPVTRTNSMKRLFLYNAVKLWKLWNDVFFTVFPFFNYLQRCSEILELSQNTFLWQSVLPIDGCCEDLEVSSVK